MTPPTTATLTAPHLARVAAEPSSPFRGAPSGATLRAPERPDDHLQLVRVNEKRRTPPVLFIGALIVVIALFGLAAFHNVMAGAQYKLEGLERELDLEQARLIDLEFQVEKLNSPATVELLARGVLGMVDPSETVDVVVTSQLLAEVQVAANGQTLGATTDTARSNFEPLLGAS